MSGQYKEKKLSITRDLEHYVRIKTEFDLINNEELLTIKNTYKNYLLSNNLPIDDNDNDNKSELIIMLKKKKIIIFLLIVRVRNQKIQ